MQRGALAAQFSGASGVDERRTETERESEKHENYEPTWTARRPVSNCEVHCHRSRKKREPTELKEFSQRIPLCSFPFSTHGKMRFDNRTDGDHTHKPDDPEANPKPLTG